MGFNSAFKGLKNSSWWCLGSWCWCQYLELRGIK